MNAAQTAGGDAWSTGPFVVGIMNSNRTVSIMDGSKLFATEEGARTDAARRCAEKPFISFVPWPVPHMAGRKTYAVTTPTTPDGR